MIPNTKKIGAKTDSVAPIACGVAPVFARCWTGLILLLTVLPYLLAWHVAPAGHHFTWVLPPYPEDGFAYQAWSRQAFNGHWLFSLKYTAAPHEPFLFQPFFLACGLLAQLTGMEIGVVHLIAKSIGVVVFFQVLFSYLKYLRFDRLQSTAAAVLVGLSSGFGSILKSLCSEDTLAAIIPVDLWLVDANTFWSLLWNPLFPWSLALTLLSIYSMDRATRENEVRGAWLAGSCVGILALIHPYPTAILIPLLASLIVFRRKPDSFGHAWRFLLAAAPAVLYTLFVSMLHPLLRKHNVMGSMEGARPLGVASGLGLPLFMALLGSVLFWKRMPSRCRPLMVWVVLAVTLFYSPLWFRGKMLFGVHVPVCILAGAVLGLLFKEAPGRACGWKTVAIVSAALLPLLCSTQVRMIRETWRGILGNRDNAFMRPPDLAAGMDYLRRESKPEDVVFASMAASTQLPAIAGNAAVWGHWAQGINDPERRAWADRVFRADSGLSGGARAREFWLGGPRYFFVDDAFMQWFRNSDHRWLTESSDKVFESPSVIIFKSRRNPRLTSEPHY